MFSKKQRLQREHFSNVLKSGKRISSKHFKIVFTNDFYGYAVVIPKKVIKLSSERHKVKRSIIEVLKTIELPQSLIVFPNSSVIGINCKDMKTELCNLLKINK